MRGGRHCRDSRGSAKRADRPLGRSGRHVKRLVDFAGAVAGCASAWAVSGAESDIHHQDAFPLPLEWQARTHAENNSHRASLVGRIGTGHRARPTQQGLGAGVLA